ncbi:MAG: hypothetical protein DLM67_13400 [Candidatus Nephthysia bennettiae]|nr:MAG: hypothetical protein DLM67_13400 [Candidatus Dormibacteraeota bacterium]
MSLPIWGRIAHAGPSQRTSAALILAIGVAWLAYTRLYFWLHPRGLTVAPSLFMHLTGRPDPLCGLTRTFAWMWRGDLAHAVTVYPVGPLVFAASFPLLGYAAAVLISGRIVRLEVPWRMRRAMVAMVVGAVALNWAAKLLWLGI